jgi:hypothetical protein
VNKNTDPPECAGPSYPKDSIDVQLPFQPTTVAAECRARPCEDGHRLTVGAWDILEIEHHMCPALVDEAPKRVLQEDAYVSSRCAASRRSPGLTML